MRLLGKTRCGGLLARAMGTRIRSLASTTPTAEGLIALIAELQALVQSTHDFQIAHHFFDDRIAIHPDLVRSGSFRSNDMLERTVNAVLKKVAPRVEAKRFGLLHIEDCGFWHGPVELSAGFAIVLYFEKIGVGLVCYAESLMGGNVTRSRFSTVPLAPNSFPSKGGSAS
jgi:hypothetical protein